MARVAYESKACQTNILRSCRLRQRSVEMTSPTLNHVLDFVLIILLGSLRQNLTKKFRGSYKFRALLINDLTN